MHVCRCLRADREWKPRHMLIRCCDDGRAEGEKKRAAWGRKERRKQKEDDIRVKERREYGKESEPQCSGTLSVHCCEWILFINSTELLSLGEIIRFLDRHMMTHTNYMAHPKSHVEILLYLLTLSYCHSKQTLKWCLCLKGNCNSMMPNLQPVFKQQCLIPKPLLQQHFTSIQRSLQMTTSEVNMKEVTIKTQKEYWGCSDDREARRWW